MKYSAVIFDWGDTISHHGVLEFIPNLFRDLFESGYRLGVLSNSDRYGDARWLRHKLCEHKIMDFIECVMGTGSSLGEATEAGSGGCHKPNPAAFKRVLDFMNVPAERSVYVGDSFKNDILATSSLGMSSVHVSEPGSNWDQDLWKLLEDDKSIKRLNVFTSYVHLTPNIIKVKMRHLTEPLQRGDRIVVGLWEYKVTECNPASQNKDEDIVRGRDDKYMTIRGDIR